MEHVTTVLIADSADDFCTALTAALQHADGFQVVGTASDGEQAIRMVEERKPDVLVLDLMLSKKGRHQRSESRVRHGAPPHHPGNLRLCDAVRVCGSGQSGGAVSDAEALRYDRAGGAA